MKVRLPQPSERYDRSNEAATRREIETALLQVPPNGNPNVGLSSRRRVVKTTASLANAVEEQGTVPMGAPSQLLLLIESDRACRLRLYANTTVRTTDNPRSASVDPPAGKGVLGEFVWVTSHTKIVSPTVLLFNADDPATDSIYYAVLNQSGSTGAITLTFTVLSVEA